jgi:FecR-like protein
VSKRLDELVREAREDLGRREADDVDWTEVDRRLLARLSRTPPEGQPGHPRRLGGLSLLLGLGAVAGAALVAIAVRVGPAHENVNEDGVGGPHAAGTQTERAAQPAQTGGAEFVVVGGAAALVNGVFPVGEPRVGIGSVVEARGGTVTVQRLGKVTLRLEDASRIRITQLGETFAISLDRGAIDAQIVPVATGVAFAVDVDRARVAVHGTRFRLRRDDPREALDLTEGVVSIEDLASAASAFVTAPAHADFVSSDAVRSLVVTRRVGVERDALRSEAESGAQGATSSSMSKIDRGASDVLAGIGAVRHEPRPTTSSTAEADRPAAAGAASVLAAAVRECLANRPRAENVTVVVHSTLYLEATEDGVIQSARFDPPVAPDVNACAAPAIYKTRLPRAGELAVPVDFATER